MVTVERTLKYDWLYCATPPVRAVAHNQDSSQIQDRRGEKDSRESFVAD